VIVIKYYLNDPMEDDVGGARRTYGGRPEMYTKLGG
jgi:hypothetical protein